MAEKNVHPLHRGEIRKTGSHQPPPEGPTYTPERPQVATSPRHAERGDYRGAETIKTDTIPPMIKIILLWALVAVQGYFLSTDPTSWFIWVCAGITLGSAIYVTTTKVAS